MSSPPAAGAGSRTAPPAAPDRASAPFTAVIARGSASRRPTRRPPVPESMPRALDTLPALPSVSALLASQPMRHRGRRALYEASASRFLLAAAALGLAFLVVLLWRTWDGAHAAGFELTLEPADGVAIQDGQGRWRAVTWDLASSTPHPDGNITYQVTWSGASEARYTADVAVVVGAPSDATVRLSPDGATPAVVEIAPLGWVTFEHTESDASARIVQLDGPAPDASEATPSPGDFIIEADLIWFADDDGLVFGLLDVLSLAAIVGVLLALRRPSWALSRLVRHMPSSDAPTGRWLASAAILSGPLADWVTESRAMMDGAFSLTRREAGFRIARRLAVLLPLLAAVLGLLTGGIEPWSAIGLVLSGSILRRLLVGADRLGLTTLAVPTDRMRTLIPGRDGALLLAMVVGLPLLVFALADLSLPFVLEHQTSQLRPFASGIRAAFWGTLWVALYTLVITIPIAVGAAIWLEEIARRGRLTRFIQALIANLAGVPSIVFGLLGLAVFVQQAGLGMGLGPTILAAGLTMSTMAMPIVALASQEALRSVPPSLREAAYGIGATRWRVIQDHVVPAALPSILTGSILAISRIIGEAAPLVVVGAAGFITFDPDPLHFIDCPTGPINGPDGQFWCTGDERAGQYTVLPFQIYEWTGRPEAAFQTLAAATSLVLLGLLLLINSAAILLRQHIQRRMA